MGGRLKEMRRLDQLIISKEHFGKRIVSQLEELVGEVLDTAYVPELWEIKI